MNESSTSPQKKLPDSWARKIFDEMHNHYGNRFLNMWKLNQYLPNGEDVGIVKAMNSWSEKLGGFSDHPECLRFALNNLPEEPPTLPTFVNLCRQAPKKFAPALDHKPTEEEIARNKSRFADVVAVLEGRKSAAEVIKKFNGENND